MEKHLRTSVLLFSAIAIAIVLITLTSPPPNVDGCALSPPAKTIRKYFYYCNINQDLFGGVVAPCHCVPSTIPIVGLNVMVWYGEQLLGTFPTDPSGTIEFIGVPDGTYEFEWMWCGQKYEDLMEIQCTQLEWEETHYLKAKGEKEQIAFSPAKTIEHYFWYSGIDQELMGVTDPIPITGLDVSVWYDGVMLTTLQTDTNGLILLTGVPDGVYTYNWSWCGEAGSREVTIFCSQCRWTFDSYLSAKGGDKAIHFINNKCGGLKSPFTL